MPIQISETRRVGDHLPPTMAGGTNAVYLTLSQVARHFPPSRNARPVHVATVTRWIVQGALLRNGTRLHLQAIRAPGRWLVEPEAVEEFLAALTTDRALPAPSPAPTVAHSTLRTAVRRRRDDARTESRLDELGICDR
jgi:hypothetical protein